MNERVPLSFLLTQNADEQPAVEPVVPFAAMFGDAVKIVTAVLARTAVLAEPSDRYERVSVRHDQVLVDPAVIAWRTRTSEYDGSRLLHGAKPGQGRAHVHRQPSRSPWRGTREADLDARERSDERARQNQREVEQAKDRELTALRKQSSAGSLEDWHGTLGGYTNHHCRCAKCRAAQAAYHREYRPGYRQAQRATKRRKNDVMSTAIETRDEPPAPAAEKQVKCFSCKTPKPVSVFPPIHRGPNVCNDCIAKKAAGEVVEVSGSAKVHKPRLKKGRATGKRRSGKKIKLGEIAALRSNGMPAVLTDGDARHTRVLALLRRQDALRADLTRVAAELQEAIAG